MRKSIITLTVAAVCFATAATAQTYDKAPVGLPYAQKMSHDKGESWTYFKPSLDLSRYRSLIVDSTVVYNGPDAQFDGVDSSDRQKYADIITEQLREELGKGFQIVQRPAPDAARIKVTLLGAEPTKLGVGTATQILPLGLALNAVKSLTGKAGGNAGSLLYAVELADSRSGELQVAAVRRDTPDALDIPSTLSMTDTVKSVGSSMGKRFREKLSRAAGVSP